MFDESELKELVSIRSATDNRLYAIQKNQVIILYLHITNKGSEVTRGMMYSFEHSYLFMDGLEHKLGDWYRPGDSVRYVCPKTGHYVLIEDDFNFYAAVQSIIPDRYSAQISMDIFINGVELKK